MTCKDCIHYECCERYHKEQQYFGDGLANECVVFKDKSLMVELPCKVGEKVYAVGHNYLTKTYKIKTIIADEFDFNGDSLFVVYNDNLRGEVVYDVKSVFLTKEEAEKLLKERE